MRREIRSIAGLSLIVVALSGCADVIPWLDPAYPDATLLIDWTPDEAGFVVVLDGESPRDLSVAFTDVASGATTTVPASLMVPDGEHRYRFTAALDREPGAAWNAVVKSGDEQIGARTIEVKDAEPDGTVADGRFLHYSGSIASVDPTPGDSEDMEAHGEFTMSSTAGVRTLTFEGRGRMEADGDGFAMDLTISSITFAEVGSDISTATMASYGTWEGTSEEFRGSGDIVEMSVTYVGRETRGFEGVPVQPLDKTTMRIHMTGVIDVDGEDVDMELILEEDWWSTIDSDETVWEESTTSGSVSHQGQTETFGPDTEAGPPEDDEDEDDASLQDDAELEGPVPAQFVAGDRFRMTGGKGLEMQFEVRAAGVIETPLGPLEALAVEGTAAAGGAQGHLRIHRAASGPHEGILLDYDMQLTRGVERYEERRELVRAT